MFWIDMHRKNGEIINLENIASISKGKSEGVYSLVFMTHSGFAFTRVYETLGDRDYEYDRIRQNIFGVIPTEIISKNP